MLFTTTVSIVTKQAIARRNKLYENVFIERCIPGTWEIYCL